jgi:hypothetical protein
MGGNREAPVGMHLFALIPGQGASQLLRQLADVLVRGSPSRPGTEPVAIFRVEGEQPYFERRGGKKKT